MANMWVEFVNDWKDYKKGQFAELPEPIAYELLGSGMALNANARHSQEREVVSVGMKKANIEGLRKRREFLAKQLEVLDRKIEIEGTALSAALGKEMHSPARDKMLRRAVSSKEA